MRGRGFIWAFVAALAITTAGIGCGGESDSSSQVNATVKISKPAFLKKAEVICQRNYDRVKVGYEDFVKGKNPETVFDDDDAVNEYVDSVILAEKEKTVAELSALGAPSGDEEKVQAILDAYEEGIEVGEEDPEAIMEGQVFAYSTHAAEEYGLKKCVY